MNQMVKFLVHFFSNHFSSRDYFCVKSMKNILESFSFIQYFWVKKLEKLLKKWRCDKGFYNLLRNIFIHNDLIEQFIDYFDVSPSRINDYLIIISFLLLNLFLRTQKSSKDVEFNHLHYFFKIRKNELAYVFLLKKQTLDELDWL